MSIHDSEHEIWLAEALSGEVDLESPEAQQRREECAMCREALDELSGIAGGLKRLGSHQQEALDEWETAPSPAPELQKKIRAAMRSENLVPARRWSWGTFAALGLAAVVLIGVLYQIFDVSNDELQLGPGWTRCEAIVSPGPVYVFHFEYEKLPENGWYHVIVESQGAISMSPDIPGNEWRPSKKEAAEWTAPFEWRVQVFNSSGRRVATSKPMEIVP